MVDDEEHDAADEFGGELRPEGAGGVVLRDECREGLSKLKPIRSVMASKMGRPRSARRVLVNRSTSGLSRMKSSDALILARTSSNTTR